MRRLIVLMAFLTLVGTALAADKFEGTWKLNMAKSTGPEKPISQQLVVVSEGDGQIVTVTGANPDGSPVITKFSVPLKGGEGKVLEGVFTGVTAKPSTETMTDFMFTKDGKPAMHVHSVMGSDGKTFTTTRHVISGQMKPGTYVDVWEKQ